MIVIDGKESAVSLSNYANLEEVLAGLIANEDLEERIVTDVFVNKEAFSELYPHQAEDIEASEISHLEIKTVSMQEMASDILVELPKVVDLMASSSRRIASLLRQADISDALEMVQDVVHVSRDFLGTIQVLRGLFTEESKLFNQLGDVLGDLLGEIGDAMVNEDWMLVADLFEYEYIPACEGWRQIINAFTANSSSVE